MYKKQKEIRPSVVQEAEYNNHFPFDNHLDIIEQIKSGIHYKLFQSIKSRSPFNDKEWAQLLSISEKSLQRYALSKNHIFKSSHSEKIIEIAQICDIGLEVFNNKKDFYQWLMKPAFAFKGKTPFSLMDNSYGIQLLIEQMERYALGIFA